MISNEYQLELVKADLVRWQKTLVELESMLATLPRAIAAQVSPNRPATIRQRIREQETEIRAYTTVRRNTAVTSSSC
jgi:hypothetical protein